MKLSEYGKTPLTRLEYAWNVLQKVRFLDILVIFGLELGQITFNPVENESATQQLAFLATSIAF